MNRRTVIIILGSAALIVVVGIAGYFFFSSPSGQAWERDWIGNPIGLTAIATVGAAVGTVGAVLIAIYGTRFERRKAREEREEAERRFTAEQQRAREVLEDERRRFQEAQQEGRRQFLASQKQTQEALEEGRKQFLEAQYAPHRPLLVPHPWETGRFLATKPIIIVNWGEPKQQMGITNEGAGIALNIRGVLMPPDPIQTSSFQYSFHHKSQLPSKETLVEYFIKGGTLFNCSDWIAQYTLCVPKERAPEENFDQLDGGDRCVARLTLTCSDIFGRKHASIFDYTVTGAWVNVAFIPNIEHDLGEMEEAKSIELSKDAKNPSSPDPT